MTEKLTLMQKIILDNFNEKGTPWKDAKYPTLKDIFSKFPPQEEKILKGDGTNLSMMISRVKDESKTMLYAIPTAEWVSIKESLFKGDFLRSK